MRYLVRAPDAATFGAILKRLQDAHVRIFLSLEKRRMVSTGDLSKELIDDLTARNVQVAPEEQYEPDLSA